MGIHGMRVGPPTIGKIRLGVREKGKNYPTTKPHFVLHDAPEVAAYYGPEPTELDCFFLTDEIDGTMDGKVAGCAPYWYKLYGGGSQDKNGNIVGGKLLCIGDGRTALHREKRDMVTRAVPERPCLVKECPDWGRGCKQAMSIFVWIPLANFGGVYQIDTTSWASMQSFVNQLYLMKQAAGQLQKIPFKLYREATKTTYFDEKSGKEKSGTQYIMKIKTNPLFWEEKGETLKSIMTGITQGGDPYLSAPAAPTPEQLQNVTMEDHYALEAGTAKKQKEEVIDTIKSIADSDDLAALFEELSNLKLGKPSTPKMRLMTARKFEGQADTKIVLAQYLEAEIAKAKAATAKKAEPKKEAKKVEVADAPKGTKSVTPPAEKKEAIATNDDGLI